MKQRETQDNTCKKGIFLDEKQGDKKAANGSSARFLVEMNTVLDRATGLMWTKNASFSEFPLTWMEAFACIHDMNQKGAYGARDWRLPNRKELFSLVSHIRTNPSLPEGHPFEEVFSGYYWTSTTCTRLPRQAWYVHLGGARVFKGMKHGSYMVWPVRSGNQGLFDIPQTGQTKCFSENGSPLFCGNTGQDGELRAGKNWPDPRLIPFRDTVTDRLTNRMWAKDANLTKKPVTWFEAKKAIEQANQENYLGYNDWRIPGVREMESITDMNAHSPAVSRESLFRDIRFFYWTDTISAYDRDYAWTLYLEDGAVGVGSLNRAEFFVWPVRTMDE